MKNLLLSAALAVGIIAGFTPATVKADDLSGFYQTGTLVNGSLTNLQTATAGRNITNTSNVIGTNTYGTIYTNQVVVVTPYLQLTNGWVDLALSPAGGVCPVDLQLFASNNSAILTNIILTLETTVDKGYPNSTTILVTNTPSPFSNSCSRVTIPAATFGNVAAFRLKSANNTGAVTNRVKVDYGFWRPKK